MQLEHVYTSEKEYHSFFESRFLSFYCTNYLFLKISNSIFVFVYFLTDNVLILKYHLNNNNKKISRQIARLCLEMPKSDKNSLRKTARELWDSIVELFTDSTLNAPKRIESTQQQHQQHQQQLQQLNASYDPSNISSFLANVSSGSTNHQGHVQSSSSSSSALKDNQTLFVIRSLFRKMLLMIKDVDIKNLMISLLATVFNIADSQVNKFN